MTTQRQAADLLSCRECGGDLTEATKHNSLCNDCYEDAEPLRCKVCGREIFRDLSERGRCFDCAASRAAEVDAENRAPEYECLTPRGGPHKF